MDAQSASPPPFPSATRQTFHRLVGHWRNQKIAKCFSLWNWDCKMYFKRAVRNGRCVCKKDGNFRFNSRVNPEVVMLCDCEFCSCSSHPTAVAVFPYINKDLILLDGAEVFCSRSSGCYTGKLADLDPLPNARAGGPTCARTARIQNHD